MKCITCKDEINPKWKFAIDANQCPFCGDKIMDENVKELFSSLRENIDDLKSLLGEEDTQLDDFLYSNYDFVHKKSKIFEGLVAERMPVEKFFSAPQNVKQSPPAKKKGIVKILTDRGVEEVESEQDVSNESTNEFFKRAGVLNEKEGFASVAEKADVAKSKAGIISSKGKLSVDQAADIIKSGSYVESEDIKQKVLANDTFLPREMIEQADPEALAEYQNMLSGGEARVIDVGVDDGQEKIPSIIQNMAARASSKMGAVDSGKRDLASLETLVSKNKMTGNGAFRR